MPGCNTGRNIQKYKGAGASTLQDALENLAAEDVGGAAGSPLLSLLHVGTCARTRGASQRGLRRRTRAARADARAYGVLLCACASRARARSEGGGGARCVRC